MCVCERERERERETSNKWLSGLTRCLWTGRSVWTGWFDTLLCIILSPFHFLWPDLHRLKIIGEKPHDALVFCVLRLGAFQIGIYLLNA